MYENQQHGAIAGGNGYGMQAAKMQAAQMQADRVGLIAAPPRQPEVAEWMERVEKAACYAEESLNELMCRLEGVTRSQAPEPASNSTTGVAAGPSTAYGAQLCSLGSRVGRLGERMQDLLRRLEV